MELYLCQGDFDDSVNEFIAQTLTQKRTCGSGRDGFRSRFYLLVVCTKRVTALRQYRTY